MALDQAWRAWLLWLCCELSWNWSGYGPEGSLESNSCPEPQTLNLGEHGSRNKKVVVATLFFMSLRLCLQMRLPAHMLVAMNLGSVSGDVFQDLSNGLGEKHGEIRRCAHFWFTKMPAPLIFWHQDVRAHFFPPRDHIKTPAHNTPTFKPHSS